MARYTGPRSKIARKFREQIFGHDPVLTKKNYPPGQHGQTRKGKKSEFAIQLMEKQKAKYIYGLLERQFSNYFRKASQKKGITGENLLRQLESRLDNTVFRLGIAPTRFAARQLVSHRHICVNNKITNIPSYALKIGDVVSIREKSKSLEVINDCIDANRTKYPWLEWDRNTYSGKILTLPERDQIPENIKENFIVELYSK